MNDDRSDNIIRQLQQLQLQQAELLAQLDTYRRAPTPLLQQIPASTDTSTPPPALPPIFQIGDQVRILNPRPFQPSKGTIIKISETRITIRTAARNTIIRAPKNIIHI